MLLCIRMLHLNVGAWVATLAVNTLDAEEADKMAWHKPVPECVGPLRDVLVLLHLQCRLKVLQSCGMHCSVTPCCEQPTARMLRNHHRMIWRNPVPHYPVPYSVGPPGDLLMLLQMQENTEFWHALLHSRS